MTRLVVVWGLKVGGASFEIGGFLLIGIETSPISTIGVFFYKIPVVLMSNFVQQSILIWI